MKMAKKLKGRNQKKIKRRSSLQKQKEESKTIEGRWQKSLRKIPKRSKQDRIYEILMR